MTEVEWLVARRRQRVSTRSVMPDGDQWGTRQRVHFRPPGGIFVVRAA